MWKEEELLPQFGLLEHTSYKEVRIRSVAEALRRLSGQSKAVVFDPYSCAARLGIEVRQVTLPEGASGCVDFSSNRPIIELAYGESDRRKRFTLSHELAHLAFIGAQPALPEERSRRGAIDGVLRREERLCNAIAAELLMPRNRFSCEATALSPSFGALSSLADVFVVSVEAALRRIRELRLWSTGIYNWNWSDEELAAHRIDVLVRKGIRRKSDRLRVTVKIRRCLHSLTRDLHHNAPEVLRTQGGGWITNHRLLLPRGVDFAVRRIGGGHTFSVVAITND